jgi:hypothetical protein
MLRVVRPDGTGASKLGAVKPIAADTPFQNLRMPSLNEGASAKALGEGLISAGGAYADYQAEANKAKYDALMVTADLNVSQAMQDGVVSWSAPYKNELTGEVNEGNATGARANTKGWVDDQLTELDDVYNKLKASDDYADLNEENKLALDKWYASQKKGYRASATVHNTTAALAHLDEQLAASQTQSLQAAQNNAMDPGAANASLKKAMNTIEQQAKAKGNSWKDASIQKQATEALDAHANTVVTNILESGAPDAVEKARQWMAINSSIDANGHTVKLTPNMRTDLNRKIALGKAGKVNRDRGDQLFSKYEGNEPAAMADLKKNNPGISDDDYNATKAQFQENQRMADVREARVKADRYEAADKKAANGHTFTAAELDNYTSAQQAALKAKSLHAREIALRPADRPTVWGMWQVWKMKSAAEKAAIPEAVMWEIWLPDMGLENGDHDKMVEEYNKARAAVGASTITAKKYSKKQDAAAQKEARGYFGTQLTNTIKGLGNALDDSEQALFRLAAEREFKERNDVKGMSNDEVEKLLLDLRSALLLKTGWAADDDSILALVLNDMRDENGKRISANAPTSDTLRAIPAKDRFEYIRWYSKTAKIKEGQLDATGLDAFLLLWGPSGSAGVKHIPAKERRAIAAIVPPGTPGRDKKMVAWYKSEMMKGTR